MLFNKYLGPDVNLEALYIGYFFSSILLRTAVSWTSTQGGSRTGLKAISPFRKHPETYLLEED